MSSSFINREIQELYKTLDYLLSSLNELQKIEVTRINKSSLEIGIQTIKERLSIIYRVIKQKEDLMF